MTQRTGSDESLAANIISTSRNFEFSKNLKNEEIIRKYQEILMLIMVALSLALFVVVFWHSRPRSRPKGIGEAKFLNQVMAQTDKFEMLQPPMSLVRGYLEPVKSIEALSNAASTIIA